MAQSGAEALGIPVHFHTTLGDDLEENIAAFSIAITRADLILVSGGLGLTQDDLTREAWGLVAGVPLVQNAEAVAAITAMFARRNRPMAERNLVQALFPEGGRDDPKPGRHRSRDLDAGGQSQRDLLPGVPSELRVMYDEQVRPRLGQFAEGVG